MNDFLSVNNLSFSIGEKTILSNINLQLQAGEIAALLGPSGCGKTTLLNLIAGFNTPQTGTIYLNAREISSPTKIHPPESRGIGMVFQDYALFPHLSVYDNIIFGLAGTPKTEALRKAQVLLELVGMPDYGNRAPHELSGGEQQRVAIARALAPKPELILLDEPFASLDANLRERLVRDLGTLLKERNIAALLVTHDQHEAFAISEKVGLIRHGNILQWDTPFNLYHQPTNPFVANFVGQGVMIKAKVINQQAVETHLGIIESNTALNHAAGKQVCLLVRPDDIIEEKSATRSANIIRKFFRGANTLYELDFQGIKFIANFNSHADYCIGDTVPFALSPDHLIIFEHETSACVC